MYLPQVLQHHSSEGRQQIDDYDPPENQLIAVAKGLHNGYRESTDFKWIPYLVWDHKHTHACTY